MSKRHSVASPSRI